MGIDWIISFLEGTLRGATPLILAGLGSILYERSGVINLAQEGFMLFGAYIAICIFMLSGNVYLAMLGAVIFTAIAGFTHGVLATYTKINQVALGLGFVMFITGATSLLGQRYLGQVVEVALHFELSSRIHIDIFALICPVLVWMVYFFLFRTITGTRLRAIGDNSNAAMTKSLSPRKLRLIASVACGGLSGLGGAYLSLIYASQWQQQLTAGRGWIVLIIVIISRWQPFRLLIAAYVFGAILSIPLYLQARGLEFSPYLTNIFIFILLLIALALTNKRKNNNAAPKDLGNYLT